MTKTSHLLDLPSYYAPEDAGSIYLERVGLVSAEAARISCNTTLQASSTDRLRVAAFAIDCQASFCHPQGSLFVPGAVEDLGLTTQQWAVFGALSRPVAAEGLSVGELARYLMVTRQNLARRLGCASRAVHADHRRRRAQRPLDPEPRARGQPGVCGAT